MGDSKEEVINKIKDLVSAKFGGDNRKAFNHYDQISGKSGSVAKAGVLQLMQDAGVDTTKFGMNLSNKYADTIIAALDDNKDVEISWQEFQEQFGG